MHHDDENAGAGQTAAGEALENVARIHPALNRLRDLIASATALDLKATAKGYWAERSDGRAGDDLAMN